MNEVLGVVILAVAVALIPLGYFWSSIWWALAAILAMVGMVVFYQGVKRKGRRGGWRDSSEVTSDATEHASGPLSSSARRSRDWDTDGADDGD
jgi:hypothetical protein